MAKAQEPSNEQEQRETLVVLLHSLNMHQDIFLERWSVRMQAAGYLQHTTAKRVDCLLALDEFLGPLIHDLEAGHLRDEFWPLDSPGTSGWGQFLIDSARRHRQRGVTAQMFLGCFKTFLYSVLDVVELVEASPSLKVAARRQVRLYGDALEMLYLEDWAHSLPELSAQKLDEMNRLLTLEKCRFENILNASSDPTFVVNADGVVENINAAVQTVLPKKKAVGRPIWRVLDMEGHSMSEVLHYYPTGLSCEMTPFGEDTVYRMQITPLNTVSLASNQYIVVLTNMTTQAAQRETLERIVDEKTDALRRDKEQLEEMNITLRNVLRSIDREREEQTSELAGKVNTLVLPALERIEQENDPAVRKGYVTVVADQLTRLTRGASDIDPTLLKLTHMEMRVSQFIQAGHSTKDIADHLNLSVETIQTHRKNIRRKLGLHGKAVSLYAHLNVTGPRG